MTIESLPKRLPARAERVFVSADPSGAITALNPVTGKIFVINDVARRVLELADGSRSVEQIVDQIASEFVGAETAAIARDVTDFIAGCEAAQLIEWR